MNDASMVSRIRQSVCEHPGRRLGSRRQLLHISATVVASRRENPPTNRSANLERASDREFCKTD